MNTVLFDLDGTLLPMEQGAFTERYFAALGKFGARLGHDPKKLLASVWEGTKAMLKNDGGATNRARFWETFSLALGGSDAETLEPAFERFYETEFESARAATREDPAARASVLLLKEKGYTVVLATNPLFPPVAIKRRLAWAGLDHADFERVTTYDNSKFCKPGTSYYLDLLGPLGKKPEECLMAGNDVRDDMSAREAGLDVYLVTDCLINEKNLPTEGFRQGTLAEFYEFVQALPSLR